MKQSLTISASDGFPISVNSFTPIDPNGKIILINSATGVKQSYYAEFATWLCESGFTVFTYDYRGIGGSRPANIAEFNATMHQWGTLDYHAVIKHLFVNYSDAEFIVIGHSVGGQIVGMSPLSQNVDKVIMIGSQVPQLKHFKGAMLNAKLIAFWYCLLPFFTYSFGYFPGSSLGLFEDLPAGVALQWARWAKSKDFVFEELSFLRERFHALNQPALMLSFSDDDLAPENAVKALMGVYKYVKWEHRHFSPEDLAQKKIGHFGFFRKKIGLALWSDIRGYILANAESNASRAA